MSETTVDLSKNTLHHVIEGNLAFLCQILTFRGNVAQQWMCVILLMQFIEYLLKYQIQSSGKKFPPIHDLNKLYEKLTDDDQNRIEACFGKLTRNRQRDPESFHTIKEFVDRYYNSYTFLRYPVLQESFSTTDRYFYVADTFLVLIALMECSDIDFDIREARRSHTEMVVKLDKKFKYDIRRQKRSKWGAPMVATGDRGIPYTYPTGDSEDY